MAEEEKTFKKIGQFKEGNFILIDGNVCRIKSIEKSKPGRHGAAKARISTVGVFDNQKRTLLKPTDGEGEVPIITRSNAQVVAVMGKTIQVMDMQNYQTFDVKKPEDLPGLKSGVEVEYLQYGDNVTLLRKK